MNEYLDYKIITIYPLLSYLFIKFCKQYYKYIFNYNLLVIDMYDNDSDYKPMEVKQTVDKETNTEDDNSSEYYYNWVICSSKL